MNRKSVTTLALYTTVSRVAQAQVKDLKEADKHAAPYLAAIATVAANTSCRPYLRKMSATSVLVRSAMCALCFNPLSILLVSTSPVSVLRCQRNSAVMVSLSLAKSATQETIPARLAVLPSANSPKALFATQSTALAVKIRVNSRLRRKFAERLSMRSAM